MLRSLIGVETPIQRLYVRWAWLAMQRRPRAAEQPPGPWVFCDDGSIPSRRSHESSFLAARSPPGLEQGLVHVRRLLRQREGAGGQGLARLEDRALGPYRTGSIQSGLNFAVLEAQTPGSVGTGSHRAGIGIGENTCIQPPGSAVESRR